MNEPNTPPEKLYAIRTRLRDGVPVIWIVALSRKGEGYLRSFAASRHGGPEGAKAAALAYRDAVMKTLPPISKREFSTIVRKNNTSGVPGVARRMDAAGRAYWNALVYLPEGKTKRRSFSVKKFGEEGARTMAIEARMQMLKGLDGWLTQHPDAVPQELVLPELGACTMQPARSRVEPKVRQLHPEDRVYRVMHRWKRRDGTQASGVYWRAECGTQDGCTRSRSFPVERHGEERARQMALEQRKQWLANPPASTTRKRRSGAVPGKDGKTGGIVSAPAQMP